jgi:outer membrane protein OmpA-like peptidoglycan-associated protein
MLRVFRLALALALMCGFVMPVTKSVASEFKVFQVKIAAPMPEALEIRKDFYINGGATHGLKELMLLDVFRPKTVVDYETGSEYGIRIFVGQLRVTRVFEEVAIARIHVIDRSAKSSVLRHRTVMIGDYASPAETDLLALNTVASASKDEDDIRFILSSSVLFGFNKWQLNEKVDETFSHVLNIFNQMPAHVLVVAGHTCNVGDREYNRILSMKRAQSVAYYLIQKGIPINQVRVEYYGEDSPIAPNDNEENRSRNRRVEVRFVPPSVS